MMVINIPPYFLSAHFYFLLYSGKTGREGRHGKSTELLFISHLQNLETHSKTIQMDEEHYRSEELCILL